MGNKSTLNGQTYLKAWHTFLNSWYLLARDRNEVRLLI